MSTKKTETPKPVTLPTMPAMIKQVETLVTLAATRREASKAFADARDAFKASIKLQPTIGAKLLKHFKDNAAAVKLITRLTTIKPEQSPLLKYAKTDPEVLASVLRASGWTVTPPKTAK